MLLSFNWLKQHVKLPDSIAAAEVAEKLKLSTVEVEGIVNQGEGLDGIAVGEILEIKKHPNADKLSIAQVDVGEKTPRQIIFGQMVKMEVGFKVPVALAPTVLPGGRKIDKTSMRGETSEGMLCLDQEMGLLKEGVSIRFFGKETKNGTPITKALGLDDYILEIDNKSLSNRPDLWGHYGMAREVAALFNRNVEVYKTNEIEPGKEIKIKIEIEDAKLCPRYMAVAMSGIKIGESPEWLKKSLMAVGLRPINNIVDITNYVMLDLGQPMHAFDGRQISDVRGQKKIIVRRANDGEEFVTLDEKKYKLDASMLVIATDEKAVALAGVMGGLESGINRDTTTIIFEAANFDASTTRKTSTKLGLRTDSSARFEKSLDPNMCEVALKRAVELVLETCPGAKVASKVADEGKPRLFVGPLEIQHEFFAKKLGVEIPVKTIVGILERLGFGVKEKKKFLEVKIPTWRATRDISIAEDVVEEVGRIFGYDNIPATLPTFSITPPQENTLRKLERRVTETLVKELGYTEVYNYSFVSGAQIAAMGEGTEKYIELNNPLSKEKPYLRRCLVLNLLENIKHNIAERGELKLFEVGKAFIPEEHGMRAEANGDELLPRQDTHLTSVYVAKKDTAPFWQARRAAEMLTNVIPGISFAIPTETRIGHHPTRSANLMFKNVRVGSVYELHPEVANRFDIEERVGIVKLNLSLLIEHGLTETEGMVYKSISPYPEVVRDLAFVVKKEITHAAIVKAIRHVDPLLTSVELFDVFMGAGIGEGYKSMAYHLTYASAERTLTTEEVDKAQSKVEKVLKEKCSAEVRR